MNGELSFCACGKSVGPFAAFHAVFLFASKTAVIAKFRLNIGRADPLAALHAVGFPAAEATVAAETRLNIGRTDPLAAPHAIVFFTPETAVITEFRGNCRRISGVIRTVGRDAEQAEQQKKSKKNRWTPHNSSPCAFNLIIRPHKTYFTFFIIPPQALSTD